MGAYSFVMVANAGGMVNNRGHLAGKEATTDAWRGYFDSFPRYVIYPHRLSERHGRVAILGHTTGSHLGLPDDEERKLALI